MKTPVSIKKRQQFDILLTLLMLFILPLYYYGLRILVMLLVALLTAVISELFYQLFFLRRKKFVFDNTSIITAMICTLLLSASVPYWLVAIAVAFGLFVAKYPFGGTGKNIFNPAATGLCFVGLCWPDIVFVYPKPMTAVPVFSNEFVTSKSAEYQLQLGGLPELTPLQELLGQYAGALGATAALVIIACFVFLLARKDISFYAPVAFIVTASVFILIFPRVINARFDSLLPEMTVGLLLFGAVFMVTDPCTSPRTKLGGIYFGILLGILTILFKHFGVNDYNFLYALLFANAMHAPCDRLAKKTGTIFLQKLSTPLKSVGGGKNGKK